MGVCPATSRRGEAPGRPLTNPKEVITMRFHVTIMTFDSITGESGVSVGLSRELLRRD